MNSSMPKFKPIVEKRIKDHLTKINVEDCLYKPEIPEVLANPSFLIVPKLGTLMAVCIYDLPAADQFWKFALEVIEDLFEIKTATGAETKVALILIEHSSIWTGLYNFRLLDRLFDKTIRVRGNEENIERTVDHFFDELLSDSSVSQKNIHLWETETVARKNNLEHIANLEFVSTMFQELSSGSPLLVSNGPSREELRQKTALLGAGTNKYTLVREPKVNNIKELLLSGGTSFYFTFDFGLAKGKSDINAGHYIDRFSLDEWIEQGSAFVNVMRGSNKSYPHLNFLRRMATYARFISYQANSPEGGLELRYPVPKLYMVLEGSLIGPEFDPTRYLRLLVSSGWIPIRLQTFSEYLYKGGL